MIKQKRDGALYYESYVFSACRCAGCESAIKRRGDDAAFFSDLQPLDEIRVWVDRRKSQEKAMTLFTAALLRGDVTLVKNQDLRRNSYETD